MPDISMCTGGKCSLKELCYRHKAKPSYYQAYGQFDKSLDDKEKCLYYWEIKKKKK